MVRRCRTGQIESDRGRQQRPPFEIDQTDWTVTFAAEIDFVPDDSTVASRHLPVELALEEIVLSLVCSCFGTRHLIE